MEERASQGRFDRAVQVLLNAIDERGSTTELGQQMVSLPLPPRLARFMVEAAKLGIEDNASLAAAMLTERDPVTKTISG